MHKIRTAKSLKNYYLHILQEVSSIYFPELNIRNIHLHLSKSKSNWQLVKSRFGMEKENPLFFFDPNTGTIYIPQFENYETPLVRALFVHELAHFSVDFSGGPPSHSYQWRMLIWEKISIAKQQKDLCVYFLLREMLISGLLHSAQERIKELEQKLQKLKPKKLFRFPAYYRPNLHKET